jgi:hypothetical protein
MVAIQYDSTPSCLKILDKVINTHGIAAFATRVKQVSEEDWAEAICKAVTSSLLKRCKLAMNVTDESVVRNQATSPKISTWLSYQASTSLTTVRTEAVE